MERAEGAEMERNRRDEMEEGGRIQVVYQKRNKDGRTRMIDVQYGSKFPRALIIWNLKFEIRRAGRRKGQNGDAESKTRRKINGEKKKKREEIGWNAPRRRPTTLRKRIGLRCLPKILWDPQSHLVRPTCRLVYALIFDGDGLGLLKVFRSYGETEF